VDLAVEVFRMLADGTRVQLLRPLIDRELPVMELAAQVGKSATSVSQHLAKLRMARLVRTRREGTQVFYRGDGGQTSPAADSAVMRIHRV
jgi:DNA-binding transcriptional ArsR family regulator